MPTSPPPSRASNGVPEHRQFDVRPTVPDRRLRGATNPGQAPTDTSVSVQPAGSTGSRRRSVTTGKDRKGRHDRCGDREAPRLKRADDRSLVVLGDINVGSVASLGQLVGVHVLDVKD